MFACQLKVKKGSCLKQTVLKTDNAPTQIFTTDRLVDRNVYLNFQTNSESQKAEAHQQRRPVAAWRRPRLAVFPPCSSPLPHHLVYQLGPDHGIGSRNLRGLKMYYKLKNKTI